MNQQIFSEDQLLFLNVLTGTEVLLLSEELLLLLVLLLFVDELVLLLLSKDREGEELLYVLEFELL